MFKNSERNAANKDPCDPCDPCALKYRDKSACKKIFVQFGLFVFKNLVQASKFIIVKSTLRHNKVKCRKIERLLPALSKLVIEEQKSLKH